MLYAKLYCSDIQSRYTSTIEEVVENKYVCYHFCVWLYRR